MNSIGVDFKLKSIEVDGKIIKLQIVSLYLNPILIFNTLKYSGIPQDKNVSEQLPHLITKELKV